MERNGSKVFNQRAANVSLQHNLTNSIKEHGMCYNFLNSVPSIVSQLSMAIVILTLNSMVIVAIFRGSKKSFRRPAFVFIAGLAVSDIVLAFSLLAFCVVLIGDFQLEAAQWVYLTSTTSICFNASVNFLFAIAADRLFFIGYNQQYSKIMKNSHVGFLIVLCWIVAVAPPLPLFITGHGSCADICICKKGEKLYCPDPSCSTVVVGFKKSFLFGLFFYFVIMLVSTSAFYAVLFWKVRHHSLRVRNTSARGRYSKMNREYQLARTVGIVITVFFCCWAPLLLLYVVDYATDDNFRFHQNVTLFVFVGLNCVAFIIQSPAMLNSLCNPIIYAARIPKMRKSLCFLCYRKDEDTSSEGSLSRKGIWNKKKGALAMKETNGKNKSKFLTKKSSTERSVQDKLESYRGSLLKSLPSAALSSSREATSQSDEQEQQMPDNKPLQTTSTWMASTMPNFRASKKELGNETLAVRKQRDVVNQLKKNANGTDKVVSKDAVQDYHVRNNLVIPSMQIDGVEIIDEVEFPSKHKLTLAEE